MEFIKNSYFTDEYNPSDINSIFDYSKRLIGQSLSTICNDDIKNFDPNQPYTVTVANDGGVPFNTIEHLGNLFSENDTEKG